MAVITQYNGTTTFIIGAGGTTVTGEVDFGFPSGGEGDIATVTIPTTGVTALSNIVCSVLASASLDHDPQDASVEGVVAYAANIIPGVSFDIVATAVNNTWGRYEVVAIF
jgi:hypothetical protein